MKLPRALYQNPVRASKWVVALFSCVGFLYFSTLIASYSDNIAAIVFLGSILLILYSLSRIFLFLGSPVIRFKKDGVYFDESIFVGGARTVVWDDIRSVSLQNRDNDDLLLVHVASPEKHIHTEGKIGKVTAPFQRQQVWDYGTPFCIKQSHIDLPLHLAKEIFDEYISSFKSRDPESKFVDEKTRLFLLIGFGIIIAILLGTGFIFGIRHVWFIIGGIISGVLHFFFHFLSYRIARLNRYNNRPSKLLLEITGFWASSAAVLLLAFGLITLLIS